MTKDSITDDLARHGLGPAISLARHIIKNGFASFAVEIRRHRTARILAKLPPERLRDCGLDPDLSEQLTVTPEEARLINRLMSMR